ncbi:MAG: hypothetical protein P4N60_08675 [Verrucomicrobiae bacterium]|nr:hypothetical protein [Verrucomicrobiae bacterium]
MTNRLTFCAIVVFWVTMNVFLWRAEYGVRGGDTPVPFELVWRKILTAPDASSLSVYQNRERMGYAEFSTSVGQSMAALDEDKLPPEGLVKRAGYQVHLAGNVALGDFTNRLKFDGRVLFTSARQWQEFTLKITSRYSVVELHSIATNQVVHVKISGEAMAMERDLTFAELENPGALVRAFMGNFADALLGTVDFPEISPADEAQKLTWDARRTRVKIGTEAVPVYRLETSALGHTIVVDVSTLGEVLRVDLPGGISARIDEWSKP